MREFCDYYLLNYQIIWLFLIEENTFQNYCIIIINVLNYLWKSILMLDFHKQSLIEKRYKLKKFMMYN